MTIQIEITDMPPVEVLTPEQNVIRILEQVVQEKGYDYSYDHTDMGCQYVEGVVSRTDVWEQDSEDPLPEEMLAPSCILGHMLYKLGEPLGSMVGTNDDSWQSIADHYLPQVSEEFHQALYSLQANQDSGMLWGLALDEFKCAVGAA